MVEPAAPEVHMYSLGPEQNAEAAFALEATADQRTKMVLARALQRKSELLPGETLQAAWSLPLKELKRRADPLFQEAREPEERKAAPSGKPGRKSRNLGP